MKKKNKLLKVVRDPNGPFTQRVHRDKTRYSRKMKHKGKNV
jgi:stalled ribosome alternative rescue factor ArfA